MHISDDTGRIAMYEYRTVGWDNSPQELMRYIYSNNLSSAMLELDDNGNIISYEEYHPFGTTAYQATDSAINAVVKRYRYTGKEQDEESGLYYHGARYYIPWLCRWTQCDPIGIKDGLNVYAYVSNNPVILHDPSGTQGNNGETDRPIVQRDDCYVAPACNPTLITPGLPTPNGGYIKLPEGAQVTSTFNGQTVTINGSVQINVVENSVWNFNYGGEEYTAQFSAEGNFTGYRSINNPENFIGYAAMALPFVFNTQVAGAVLTEGTVAALATSQADSPVPGPADAAAVILELGVLVTAGAMLLQNQSNNFSITAPVDIAWETTRSLDATRDSTIAIPIDKAVPKDEETDSNIYLYRNMRSVGGKPEIGDQSLAQLGLRSSDVNGKGNDEIISPTDMLGISVTWTKAADAPFGGGSKETFKVKASDLLKYNLTFIPKLNDPTGGLIVPIIPTTVNAFRTSIHMSALSWNIHKK